MTFFLKPEIIIPPLTHEEVKENIESKVLEFFEDPYFLWEPSNIDADCLVYASFPKTIEQEKGLMKQKFIRTEWVTEIYLFKYVEKNKMEELKEEYSLNLFSQFIKKTFIFSNLDELNRLLVVWKKFYEV